MPLRTETYDLDDEEERIEDELGELAEVLESIENDNPAALGLLERQERLQTQLQGIRWARDEAFEADYAPAWDEDVAEITLAGLTGGEFGAMQDDLESDGAGSGAARVYQVERGTEDAPYIDDSMGEDQRISTVANLPVHYLIWAEARIGELTGMGGNAEINYGDLLEESQAETST
ncbi:hypothetical protein [Natrialba aegyptia]|uniref:Uncharacterized protein n=1 Tax=Natrialba aegyptia DSM 13077 TaxID=1227491 RepID=M0B6V0_9EURY|nr:hypothetical protein [Natrialba aegyptia]ELZ05379.1 hypothetical protein C480_10445 [Natrialba aegyptia DSM 13077]